MSLGSGLGGRYLLNVEVNLEALRRYGVAGSPGAPCGVRTIRLPDPCKLDSRLRTGINHGKELMEVMTTGPPHDLSPAARGFIDHIQYSHAWSCQGYILEIELLS
jgi:hypothetical protein